MQALREHVRERTWIHDALRLTPKLSIYMKVYKWIGVYTRGRSLFEYVRTWSEVLRAVISVVQSLRALSIFVVLLRGVLR